MATAARPLWSLHRNEKQQKKWGKEKYSGKLFSLRESANIPTWREASPSLGGRTIARRGGAPPRAHRLRAASSRRGRSTDFSQLYFSERRLKGASLNRTSGEHNGWVNLLPSGGNCARVGNFGSRFSSVTFGSVPAPNMPERISVSDFVVMTNEDLSSPGTSGFQSKMSDCRNTVSAVEEVGRTHARTFPCCLPVYLACSY